MDMKSILRKIAAVLVTSLVAVAAVAAEMDDFPDPTNPAGYATGASPSGVQSILITPRYKQAVIHGRTLRVGDRVGDAVIVDIQPYEVILNRGGRESRMRLVPRLDKQKKEDGAS